MNNRLRKTLIELFFGFVIIYAALNAYQTLRLWRSDLGWESSPRSTRRVALVFPDGPATILRPGDELIAVNGQPITIAPSIRKLTPGTDYLLTVRRNGELNDFNLRTAPISVSDWLMAFILVVLFPAISIATGLAVFLLKPDNKHALLVALAFGCFIPPLAFHWFEGLPRLLAFVMYTGPLVTTFFMSFILHLFLVFPERSPILRRWPSLEWFPYLPVPLLIWVNIQPTPTAEIPGLVRGVYTTVMVLATTLSFLLTYRRANEVSRRKLRVIMADSRSSLARRRNRAAPGPQTLGFYFY